MSEAKVTGAIAVGGALGALTRFGVSLAALALLPGLAMAGTLIANIAGSFVIGMAAAWVVRRGVSLHRDAFLITGFCGGFTTFSAFSLETAVLIVNGDWLSAGLYVLVSVPLWLASAWAGWSAGMALVREQ